MLDLIKYIVEQFAEDKANIEYKTEETDDAITVTVLLADSDMGKVIGKQGKIAKALRISQGTVKSRLSRGKKLLREKLSDD